MTTAHQRQAGLLADLLTRTLEVGLHPRAAAMLPAVLTNAEAAVTAADLAGLATARADLIGLAGVRLTSHEDEPEGPAPELPRERINQLVHRLRTLSEPTGPAGAEADENPGRRDG